MKGKSVADVPAIEPLEPRVLMDAALHGGVWRIHGDDAPGARADEIVIRANAPDPALLEAVVNGEVVGTVAAADVKRIQVRGGKGDDVIRINVPADAPAIAVTVFGGAGDDTITGDLAAPSSDWPGDNVILIPPGGSPALEGPVVPVTAFGGAGNDAITGGTGADRLVGGRGNDTLNGGAGDDLMRGGPGRDTLAGDAGIDRLFGGGGRDEIHGVLDQDRLHLGRVDRFVDASAPPAYVTPDPGPGWDLPTVIDPHARIPDELRRELIEMAVRENRHLFGKVVKTPVYPPATVFTFDGPELVEAAGAGTAQTTSADPSFTNVREEGVGEGDLVQTDGEHLFVLDGSDLVILDALPAEDLRVLSRTGIFGQPRKIYLYDDRAIVISAQRTYVRVDSRGRPIGPPFARTEYPNPYWEYGVYSQETIVTVLDVADPAAPQAIEVTRIEAFCGTTDMVDGKLRLIIHGNSPSLAPIKRRIGDGSRSIYETEAEFRTRMEEEIDDSFVACAITADGETTFAPLLDADHAYLPQSLRNTELLQVVTFDVADDVAGPASTTAVWGAGGYVYTTPDSLYAGNRSADVQRLDLRGNEVVPAAAGDVPGEALYGFPMDEHEGTLRILTRNYVAGRRTLDLHVLAANGDRLEVVGSLTDFAPDESLSSIRFDGDTAYVMTYARDGTDSLHVLDLSDPTNPTKVSELTGQLGGLCLQPIGDGHIIGVGRYSTSAETGWSATGVCLLDVSDPADPRLVDTFVFERTVVTRSVAEGDPQALSYFGDHGILAIPVSDPTLGESDRTFGYNANLEVLRIDLDGGFEHLGTIEQDGEVRRSLRIGEYLYSVSNQQVQVHPIADPADQIASVNI